MTENHKDRAGAAPTQLDPAPTDATGANAVSASPASATSASAGASHLPTAGATAGTAAHEAVAGPFTVRDLVASGGIVLLFIGSLLPLAVSSRFGFWANLWNTSSLFFLGIGIVIPLVVLGLLAARRLNPASAPRIGSLSVDQFASVAGVLAAVFFFLMTVTIPSAASVVGLVGGLVLVTATTIAPHLPFFAPEFAARAEAPAAPMARDAIAPVRRPSAPKPTQPKQAQQKQAEQGQAQQVQQVQGQPFSGEAAGVSASTREPVVTGWSADQASADHDDAANRGNDYGEPSLNATDHAGVNPTEAGKTGEEKAEAKSTEPGKTEPGKTEPGKTEPEETEADRTGVAAQTTPGQQSTGQPTTIQPAVGQASASSEPISATRDHTTGRQPEPVYDAFWFAVGQTRDIVDEHTGQPVFTVEPGAWILALQDRGHEFLVQNTDGKVGVLRDLTNIERA